MKTTRIMGGRASLVFKNILISSQTIIRVRLSLVKLSRKKCDE